ncbi:MAG TPA: TonB family protein [Verrucomicrobiae bacterium]
MSKEISSYELKDDLARFCLPSATRDPNRKLAWTNSICFIFLLIGLLGARRGLITVKPVPPMQEIIPIIIEPAAPPPPTVEQKPVDDTKPDPQPVAVVIPQAPNINFSVPTIGSLVVPANLAAAPPLEPLQMKTAVAQIDSVGSTGMGGDRPQPPYPKIALEEGEQGAVTLTLVADAAGNVISADVKETSGFPLLDRSAADFIKRRWRLPANAGNQVFETKITYKLQSD